MFLSAHARYHTDPRLPACPEATPAFATDVRLLTRLLDTPAPGAPFSVHRTALAGKELGEGGGRRPGASTAAGVI
jgi:cysteine protease ATG4